MEVMTVMENDLLARVPEWEREAARFEQKAQALRQMVEAVRVLNGDAARLFGATASTPVVNQYSTEAGPRGREAVRRITAERPGVWLIRDIKRINRENGWPSSDSSMETAVARLAASGEAVKVPGRKGAYRFGPEIGPRATSEGIGQGVRLALGPASTDD